MSFEINKKHEKQIQKFLYHVSDCIAPYRSILLAFSGGLDSTVLLNILVMLRDMDVIFFGKEQRNKLLLRAMHIHHALNYRADWWAEHCARECYRHNVIFNIKHITVNKKSGNIEARARNARYQALLMTLKTNEALLTAHHKDDQAETCLLALKRGSGPNGLAAMSSSSNESNLKYCLLRPLLSFSREELETYARLCGLHWIEDDDNANLKLDRIFLRLKILPSLKQRWPKFPDAIARSAKLCAEQEELLDELLKDTLANVVAPDKSLNLTPLKAMNEVKRSALLRRWLASLAIKMPTRKNLIRVWEEVALSRRDSVAQLKIDENRFVRRFKDRLHIVKFVPCFIDSKTQFLWPVGSEQPCLPSWFVGIIYRHLVKEEVIRTSCNYININNEKNISQLKVTIVRAPTTSEEVSIRFGSVSGLLHIINRSRRRTLKKIWQELGVPPWQRLSTPLLFYNDKLISALGVFITRDGIANQDVQWKIFWQLEL
ncbi:tRNA lysidine(34) synthetase TilS [Sodalis sp. CWE]|nr:tRNA lysidine(34) synthetase TilS [Sodalis sp. CWE]